MAQEGYKRKLTAILSADVEGYSRLMGENEDATIRTLTSYRCLLYTSPSPRDATLSRMPSSA